MYIVKCTWFQYIQCTYLYCTVYCIYGVHCTSLLSFRWYGLPNAVCLSKYFVSMIMFSTLILYDSVVKYFIVYCYHNIQNKHIYPIFILFFSYCKFFPPAKRRSIKLPFGAFLSHFTKRRCKTNLFLQTCPQRGRVKISPKIK